MDDLLFLYFLFLSGVDGERTLNYEDFKIVLNELIAYIPGIKLSLP